MSKPTAVFFGSFLQYSVIVLEKLLESSQVEILGVVTTPPMPAGRKQILTKTHVHQAAEKHTLTIFTPDKLNSQTLTDLPKVDFFITAGYGKLLPETWLTAPQTAALNLHFSLLPKYRGANPAEWALLAGETQTGVTVINMSPEFDTGHILAQAELPIEPTDTRETVYQKLYDLGGELLPKVVTNYSTYQPKSQPESPTPYAKRFTRDDSFIGWPAFKSALHGNTADKGEFSPVLQEIISFYNFNSNQLPEFIDRATRALAGFPGVWTIIPTIKGEKRMKVLQTHLDNGLIVLDQVQLEGQQPTTWNSIKNLVQRQ